MTRTHDLCPAQVERRARARLDDLSDAIRKCTARYPLDVLNGRGAAATSLLDDLIAEFNAITDALNAHEVAAA